MVSKIMFHINSLGKGGAERVVVNLSEEFAKMGKEVVIATEWKAKDEYPLPDEVRRLSAGLEKEEEKLSGGKQRKLRTKRLHELIVREKPDVVLSFCRNANYRAVLAAEGTKTPVIVSVRSDPYVDYASAKQKLLSRLLYGRAAGAVFQTDYARDFFSKKLQKISAVILNPLHRQFLSLTKAERRKKEIVTAGRFHEAKDHIVLIRAFERIMEEYPEVTLKLYGEASEDNTHHLIREHIKAHCLQDRVLLMGNSSHLERDLIDAAVFVLSSKYEGMPNALMEAMAMQLPVISTDCPCGGPRTLIKDGVNGLLVPVGDDGAMAEAIRRVLSEPERAEEMAVHAGEIVKKAAPDRIAREWLDYIEKREKEFCRKKRKS